MERGYRIGGYARTMNKVVRSPVFDKGYFEDGIRFFRGAMFGALLSIPLWTTLAWIVFSQSSR